MTVKKLKEALEMVPDDFEVWIDEGCGGRAVVQEVKPEYQQIWLAIVDWQT